MRLLTVFIIRKDGSECCISNVDTVRYSFESAINLPLFIVSECKLDGSDLCGEEVHLFPFDSIDLIEVY